MPSTTRIRPSSRIRLLPSVVLPQPDSPAMPMISPSATVKRDAVERADVALQGAVVDAQVVDGEGHVRLSLGLKTSSSPTFIT